MKYQPPYGPNWPNVDDPQAPYVNGNPPAGIKGSVPPAQSIEYPMREIVHTIEKGGFVPADTDLYQLTRGVRRALFAWGIDTGSANALSVALDPPLLAYAAGTEIRVLVANDNTGASTIRVNGLATQQIIKRDGAQLFAGELRRGGIAVLVHDGTYFQLVSGGSSSLSVEGDGWFNGADWVVDTGTPNHIIGTPLIAPTSYVAGQGYAIYVKNRNTGPVDVNLNNLGVKSLKHPTGQDMQIGDIVPNMVIYVRYDGTDFYMLSPIHMAIIYQSLTFIVGPNATPTPDFPDLVQALVWAGRRRIGITGFVNFKLQGQTTGTPIIHNYSAPIQVRHPDGDRLMISGAGMNSIPKRANFAVTGFNPSGDAATNINMLKTRFQSELHFTASSGLSFDNTRCNLKDLLVTGPGMTTNGYSGISVNDNSTVIVDCIASCNTQNCWVVGSASVIAGQNVYAVGAGLWGWGVSDGASVSIGGPGSTAAFVISGTLQNAITMGNQAQMNIETAADWPAIYSCGGDAIYMYGSSNANMNKLFIYYCNGMGLNATSSATFRSDGGNVSNAGYGFVVTVNSDANVPNWMTANCTNGDYTATIGASIYASGYQNGSAQFSPTKNTNGNGNAYIVA